VITITEQDEGNAPCDYTTPDNNGFTPLAVIKDSQGNEVWCSSGCGLPNTGGGGPAPQLQPGQSASRTYTWDQTYQCTGSNFQGCQKGQQVPAGHYNVSVAWDPPNPYLTGMDIG
jgi:hypothetical protein